MKIQKLIAPKSLALIAAFSVLGIFVGSKLNQNYTQNQVDLYKANSGLGICKQRIIQSFTAIMIKDLSSNYLSEGFQQMSSDCLNEVSSVISSLVSNKKISNQLNNLKSDTHWFYQKLNRLVSLAEKENVNVSESNIVSKYAELENLGSSIEDGILQEATFLENSMLLSSALFYLSFFSLGLCMVVFAMSKRVFKRKEEFNPLDMKDEAKLFNYLNDKGLGDFALSLQSYILDLKEKKAGAEDMAMTLQEERSDDPRYNIDLDILNTPIEQEIEELEKPNTVDFVEQFAIVSKRLEQLAKEKNITLDISLADHFKVVAEQEQLQQLIYSLVNFGMECVSDVKDQKRLKISAKPLGGISYLKVETIGALIDDDKKSFLNGKNQDTTNLSMDIILLKEIFNEMDVKFALKNKQNANKGLLSTEIEIVLKRSAEDESTKSASSVVSVIRGNKSEVRRILDESSSRLRGDL